MSSLVYRPLNAEARELRLLALASSTNDSVDQIEGTLTTRSLDERPGFDALSHGAQMKLLEEFW